MSSISSTGNSRDTGKPRRATMLAGTIIAVAGLVASVTAYVTTSIATGQSGDAQQISAPVITESFCLNRSLGGPVTYPLDTNGDGVADICSLDTTRRVAAARQEAYTDLSLMYPQRYGLLWAQECLRVENSYGETDKEPRDQCAEPRRAQAEGRVLVPVLIPPAPAANTNPGLFYSGPVITGPTFCVNYSLGGPATWAYDSTGDGVADICSLNTTRRAAVARQWAAERLAEEEADQFERFFAVECRRVPFTLGEPDKEPLDQCAQYLGSGSGTPGGGTPGGGSSGGSTGGGSTGGGSTGGGGPSLPTASQPGTFNVAAAQNLNLAPGNQSFTAQWDRPLTRSDTVFRYILEWSTSPSSFPSHQRATLTRTAANTWSGSSTDCAVNSQGRFQCTVGGLLHLTTYYVRVLADRGASNDPYTPSGRRSTTPSVTTGIPGPPTWGDTPLASPGFGTITATWNIPAGTTYTPALYIVQWSTSPTGWSSNQQMVVSVANLPTGCSRPTSGGDFACDIAGLTNNRVYYVRLQGVASSSGPGTYSTTRSLRLSSTLQNPGVPTNLSLGNAAVSAGTTITATWAAPSTGPAPTGYLVQWRSCGTSGSTCEPWSGLRQQRVSGTTAAISDLTLINTYQVRVQAATITGASGWSRVATIALGIPQPPTNLIWEPLANSFRVQWDAPDVKPDPDYYIVQWSTNSRFSCTTNSRCDSTSPANANTVITEFNGAPLEINDTYYVRVRAVVNATGPGEWSATLRIIPGTIQKPSGLSAGEVVGSPQALAVTWTTDDPIDRPSFTGFSLRWRVSGSTSWSTRNLTSAQASDPSFASNQYGYTLTGLTGGTSYEIQVATRNSYGSGPWSDSTTGTPGSSLAPTGVAAAQEITDNPRALSVSWTRGAWGSEAITGFSVQWRGAGTTRWSTRNLTLTSSGLDTSTAPNYTYLLSGLTAGTSYEIRVAARTRHGQGAWSATTSSVIPGSSFKPVGIAATASTSDPRALNLSWTQNAANVITGFSVQWRTSGTSSWRSSRSLTLTSSGLDTSAAPTYTYLLSGLTAGASYEVRVQARAAGGSGPWSDTTSATPGSGAAFSPTGLTPAGGISGVTAQTVSWNAVTPSSGATVRSYTVQWRACGIADSTDDCDNWSSGNQHTTSNDSTTQYRIAGLLDGFQYEWRVRANFTSGTSGWTASELS